MSIWSFYWLEWLPEWVAGQLDCYLSGLLAACVPVFDSSDTRQDHKKADVETAANKSGLR